MDELSKGDPTKWEEITEWKVMQFLNTVSYFKDKRDFIAEEQKKVNGK